MKKLLKINKIIILFITAAVFYGCGKESSKENFAARVNKSYLFKSEIDSLSLNSKNYQSEIIRNWINREVLYQQASKEGILDSKEFKNAIENSKKELAASLMLQHFLEKKEIKTDLETLQSYYNNHIDEYRLEDDSYLMNILNVSSEAKAIKYRTILLENNLKRLSSMLDSDSSKISFEQNVFKSQTDIHPASLMRLVNELNPGEVSIVINGGNNSFYIVQLINKFPKGTIPTFDFVRAEVEKRYSLDQRNKIIREYLDELYSKNEIEIRTGKK